MTLSINKIIVSHEVTYDKDFFKDYCSRTGVEPSDDNFLKWVSESAGKPFIYASTQQVSMKFL